MAVRKSSWNEPEGYSVPHKDMSVKKGRSAPFLKSTSMKYHGCVLNLGQKEDNKLSNKNDTGKNRMSFRVRPSSGDVRIPCVGMHSMHRNLCLERDFAFSAKIPAH